MIIYKTTNLINGKIYVGKDCNNNPKYLGSGHILQIAIKKNGRQNFKKETLELCDANNWEEKERYWIEKLGSRNREIGYNICPGGDGFYGGKDHPNFGRKLPESHRKNISKSCSGIPSPFKGVKRSEEFNRSVSNGLMGRAVSSETRKKISKAHKDKNIRWTDDQKNIMSEKIKNSQKHKQFVSSDSFKDSVKATHTGKIVSAETRKKISEWNHGKKRSPEARAAMSAWQKGIKHSDEYKKRMSQSLKRSWLIRKAQKND